jgi:hypothetical protein
MGESTREAHETLGRAHLRRYVGVLCPAISQLSVIVVTPAVGVALNGNSTCVEVTRRERREANGSGNRRRGEPGELVVPVA